MGFSSNTFVIVLSFLLLSLVRTHVSEAAATPAPVNVVSWTWIGGENGTNNPGNYGTLNETFEGNVPGGRVGAAAWVGGSSLAYLFGGVGYDNETGFGYLNDFWQFNTSSLEWTFIGGSSIGLLPVIYETFRVDSAVNIPERRAYSAFWQSDEQHFWLFGGLGPDGDDKLGVLSDVWLYDTASGNWTWVAGNDTANAAPVYGPRGTYGPKYSPGGRIQTAFWTGSDGLLWLFGGENFFGKHFSDLWSFNTSSFEWAYQGGSIALNQTGNYSAPGVVNASNAPGARAGPATWTDAEGNLWLHGGSGYGNNSTQQGFLNDLWVYNASLSVWIFIAGNDTVDNLGVYGTFGELSPSNYPGGRAGAMSFVDALGNLQLFGGFGIGNSTNNAPNFLNDLWVFDLGSRQWAWINGSTQVNAIADYGVFNVTSPNVVPGARYGSVLWNINGNDPILFGGDGYSNTSGIGLLNDVFTLTEVLPTPTPTATPTATPTPTPIFITEVYLVPNRTVCAEVLVNITNYIKNTLANRSVAVKVTSNCDSIFPLPPVIRLFSTKRTSTRLSGPIAFRASGDYQAIYNISVACNTSSTCNSTTLSQAATTSRTALSNGTAYLPPGASGPIATPSPEPEPVLTGGSAVCFPADASVLIDDQNHVVPMSQIRPGMSVMGADQHGRLVPDTVLSWLHYEPSAVGEVLVIATASGKRLRLTRHHLVYRLGQQEQKQQQQQKDRHMNENLYQRRPGTDLVSAFEAVYAERVRVGDALYDAVSRSLDRVVSIESTQTLHGLYAPLTRTGRLVVDGLLVSCYGTYPSHAVSHAVLWPARVDTLRGRWASLLGVHQTHGIMPYAAHLYGLWTSIDRMIHGIKVGMIAAAC